MDKEQQDKISLFLEFQQAEIDGAALYAAISRTVKDERNKSIIQEMAKEEAQHADVFKAYTEKRLAPRRFRIAFYVLLNAIFGYTFCIKFFERNENKLGARYEESPWKISELVEIIEDERRHEDMLFGMLDEERVRYTGSIVLGMNDALIELTGSLAGYTLAMRDTRMIAMAGLITGISATFSMAASDYLSTRAEGKSDALKSSLYTGFAYLVSVFLLILPHLFLGKGSYLAALFSTMAIAVGIIAAFNIYTSVVLNRPFRRSFLEMSGLSLGIAAVSFVVGLIVKHLLGVDL